MFPFLCRLQLQFFLKADNVDIDSLVRMQGLVVKMPPNSNLYDREFVMNRIRSYVDSQKVTLRSEQRFFLSLSLLLLFLLLFTVTQQHF